MALQATASDLPLTPRIPPAVQGAVFGVASVIVWGAYLALARKGVAAGLRPQDFVLLRYGTAGLIMLPWLVRHGLRDLAGIGWARGVALTLGAGPLFFALGVGGYVFAPLAHGAVIQPSTATVCTMFAAWALFSERPPVSRFIGVAVIVTGLVLIATGKSGTPMPGAWRGDLMFMAAGLCWMGYTLLLRHWRIDGLRATAAVSVIAALVVIPGFVLFDSFGRLAEVPLPTLLLQILVQGVLAGVLAMIAYGKTVQYLGAAKAALFPAIVPAAALIIGLGVTGEVPSLAEWIGAALATAGLTVAMGVVGGRGTSKA